MTAAAHTGDAPEERSLRQEPGAGGEPNAELLESLSGLEANRERAVAHRTRRVVMSSLGVLKEQNQDRKRARAVALAITVVVLLLMAPLIWVVADSLLAGEHLGDMGNQLGLWACVACPTLLGAALVAWWRRNRA